MKFITAIIILASTVMGFAANSNSTENTIANDTTTFKVYGNCGMCKKRIEKAVKVDGVESASWSSKTKMISVVYDSSKISLEQIHQRIADVGHDTELVYAKDEVYEKLHECCQYDRREKK